MPTKTLMHKDDPVVTMRITPSSAIEEVLKIHNPELLPENNGDPKISLERWLLHRNICQTRKDIDEYIKFYGGRMFRSVTMRSLFDTYWIRSSAQTEDWEAINAFDNWDPDDDDILLSMFAPDDFEGPRFDSPNLTIPGTQPRLWCKTKDYPLGLINLNAQEAMHGYMLAKENGITIVNPKTYIIFGRRIYTYEPATTSKNIEQLPFDSLYNRTAEEGLSNQENLQKCCETFKIPGWKEFFNQLLDYDMLCGKEDRTLFDIKILRDTETLKILGFDKL